MAPRGDPAESQATRARPLMAATATAAAGPTAKIAAAVAVRATDRMVRVEASLLCTAFGYLRCSFTIFRPAVASASAVMPESADIDATSCWAAPGIGSRRPVHPRRNKNQQLLTSNLTADWCLSTHVGIVHR